MRFLLDPSIPEEQFIADIPSRSSVLMHFCVGERRLKEGRLEQAAASFREAAWSQGDDWLKARAEARLAQLRPQLEARANGKDAKPEVRP